MKSRTTRQVFYVNTAAAVLCILFTLWLAICLPEFLPLWSGSPGLTERVQSATTAEQLNKLLHEILSRGDTLRSDQFMLYRFVLVAWLALFALLVLNSMLLRRLDSASSHIDYTA